jgi:hypothetical protein
MARFSAYQAAVLADDIYALTKLSSLEQAIKYLESQYGNAFTLSDQNMLAGKTGGPCFIKVRTAFGFTMLGCGKFQGHAVILFRGTQYLADWLTNLNIGVSRSSSAQPVHDGFNQSFKSMLPQLQTFMANTNKNRIHTIHCIGHSLGGALATLCGEWINVSFGVKPYIYSFGSPRVGLMTFANSCTRNIGADRIFRAYHKTDIVPCIPIWPFVHTPNSGIDYYLPSPGIIPMAEYHGMNHYINSVEGKDWDTISKLRTNEKDDDSIARWLRNGSPIGFTITSIEWLSHALLFVLKNCMNGSAFGISQTFSSTYTLMDKLAYVLETGVNLVNDVSSWVLFLMRKIMEILGLGKVLDAADLSREFIQRLLMRLQERINQYVQGALGQIMAQGRNI